MKFFSENISKKSRFLGNSKNRYHIGYTSRGSAGMLRGVVQDGYS